MVTAEELEAIRARAEAAVEERRRVRQLLALAEATGPRALALLAALEVPRFQMRGRTWPMGVGGNQ